MLTLEHTPLQDCFILKPQVFKDARGTFMESFNEKRFKEITGLDLHFVQDNQSTSEKGVLRGLHFQSGEYAQAKLVRVVSGKVLDVVVDLRPYSPTFKKYFKVVLSDENQFQLFVPKGFAHGFITLSETSIFSYKCDNYYHQESESGIIWNDASLNIDWEFPEESIKLSPKDVQLPTFNELDL